MRFDKDEEFISSLENYAKENKITAAQFNGIGTCSKVELAFFNWETKVYDRKIFNQHMEIVSLIGNIAMKDDKAAVHVHGSFSNEKFQNFGGHVMNVTVLATIELNVIVLDGILNRENNPDLNLNLLS